MNKRMPLIWVLSAAVGPEKNCSGRLKKRAVAESVTMQPTPEIPSQSLARPYPGISFSGGVSFCGETFERCIASAVLLIPRSMPPKTNS